MLSDLMRSGRLIVGALILLTLPVPARAQDATGMLAGCATDTAGQPVSRVTIDLSARDVHRTMLADEQGCFEAKDLPPRTYVLVATLTGLANETRDELQLVPGGRLRVDFQMRVPPMCECLSAKPPTVESLWTQANVVARVRITGHDRQFEYRSAYIVHAATVLDLWKGPGQRGSAIQFNQHLWLGTPPRYAVGDEFVLFLTELEIVGAFEIVGGRVQGQDFRGQVFVPPTTGFLDTSADDLMAEIAAQVGR